MRDTVPPLRSTRYARKTLAMSIDATAQAPALSRRVAEEIRVAMVRRGISGAGLARSLGVSQAWISYRLTGVQPIDLNDLERIARALQVEIVDLLPRAVAEVPRTLGYAETHASRSLIRPVDNRPRSRAGRPGPASSSTRTRRVVA